MRGQGRRCKTCKRRRPLEEFDGLARRCDDCWEKVVGGACAHCGGLVPVIRRRTRPRRYCDAPECQAAARAMAGAQRRPELEKGPKKCPVCGERKPRTDKHWHAAKRDPATGEVVRLHAYCKLCEAADSVARYKTDARRREQTKARAKRQRARIRARRAADPDFDREYRAKQRAYARVAAARRRGDLPPPTPPPSVVDREQAPTVPARPLADVITEHIRRQQLYLVDDANVPEAVTVETLCADLGVHPRSYTAWRSGERLSVSSDIVDRVLVNMGLNWWDVYDEERYPEEHARAEAVFG